MKLLWNTYWKMILGIFVALMVVSFVAAVALYAVFIVALVFAIRYLINYRKIDKKDVSKIPAAFYKQWWFYALIISFIFIVGSSLANGSNNSTDQSSNNLESKNLKLSFDSKKIETNDKGNATISGKTEKGASIVAGTIHTDTADDEGNFSVTYPLTSATEKTINVTATGKNGNSKVLKVTIIPSKIFSDNEKSKLESEKKASSEESKKEEAKAKANSQSESKAAVESKNKEKYKDDITHLAEEPTTEQSVTLDMLAKQQFDKQYPYKGSKIHTFAGAIQRWTKDGNKWFGKYEATIVNAFGAERKTTLEIKIEPKGATSGYVEFTDY